MLLGRCTWRRASKTCRRALHEWSCRCVFVCAGFVWVLWSVWCAFKRADALCTSGAAGVCLCVQGLCGCYGLCCVLSKRADALCTSGAAGVCVLRSVWCAFETCRRALHEWGCRCGGEAECVYFVCAYTKQSQALECASRFDHEFKLLDGFNIDLRSK